MRRVRTASGATAVQIVHKRGRTVVGIEHIGSAHDEGQLWMLLQTARARLRVGQEMLPIGDGRAGGRLIGEPVVEGTASLVVWERLEAIYEQRTPRRPPGHRWAADHRGRVPAGCAPVRREQGRNPKPWSGC